MSRAAHTASGGGEAPSIFDLLAQESLVSGLRPAGRHLVNYLSARRPTSSLQSLKAWYEEAYTLLEALVENHYLKTHSASFSEHFYGLRRVAVTTGALLDSKHRFRSLIALVLVPYIRLKLDEFHARLRERLGNRPPTNDPMERMQRAFLAIYPFLNTGIEAASLLLQLAYVTSKSSVHSPWLLLAGVRIRRQTAEDIASETAPASQEPSTLAGRLAGLLSGLGRGSVILLSRLLGLGLFLVQFLDWWYNSSEGGEVSAAMSRGRSIPPAPQTLMTPSQLVRSLEPGQCPLCRRPRKNDTLLAVSGYGFPSSEGGEVSAAMSRGRSIPPAPQTLMTPSQLVRSLEPGQCPLCRRPRKNDTLLAVSGYGFPSSEGGEVSAAMSRGRSIPPAPQTLMTPSQLVRSLEPGQCPLCRRPRKNDTLLAVSGYGFPSSEGGEVSAAMSRGRSIPPAPQTLMTPSQLVRSLEPGQCPLCRRPRKNDTLLAVSGYGFPSSEGGEVSAAMSRGRSIPPAPQTLMTPSQLVRSLEPGQCPLCRRPRKNDTLLAVSGYGFPSSEGGEVSAAMSRARSIPPAPQTLMTPSQLVRSLEPGQCPLCRRPRKNDTLLAVSGYGFPSSEGGEVSAAMSRGRSIPPAPQTLMTPSQLVRSLEPGQCPLCRRPRKNDTLLAVSGYGFPSSEGGEVSAAMSRARSIPPAPQTLMTPSQLVRSLEPGQCPLCRRPRKNDTLLAVSGYGFPSSEGGEVSAAMSRARSIPPAPQTLMTPSQLVRSLEPGQCPLCRRPRKNDTLLAVSGYGFPSSEGGEVSAAMSRGRSIPPAPQTLMTPSQLVRSLEPGQCPLCRRPRKNDTLLAVSGYGFPSSEGGEVSAAMSRGRSIPPAPQTLMTPSQLVRSLEPGQCPLCRRPRKNDPLLAVSGYVFCYTCIYRQLERTQKCPVTGQTASSASLVRLFLAPSQQG